GHPPGSRIARSLAPETRAAPSRPADRVLATASALHDSGTGVGVQARPADEGAVDVVLGQQVRRVGRRHRAPVLDAESGGHLLARVLGDRVSYGAAHALRVLGRGVLPGADGPDRLVGDHQLTHLVARERPPPWYWGPARLVLRRTGERRCQLGRHRALGCPSLPLVERLA